MRIEPSPKGRAKRTLLAYDGSPSAQRALRRAVAMHHAGEVLGVIHVSAPGGESDGELAEACRLLAESGIDATPIAGDGNPAHAICVAAERDDYDTIIVGRRNLRGAGLLLLGSVAARVVSGAVCDVVVVT